MLLKVNYSALTLKMADKILPQSDLMKEAGISQAVIRHIQGGKPIKPETVGTIARVLDCDPADIATPVSPLREKLKMAEGTLAGC